MQKQNHQNPNSGFRFSIRNIIMKSVQDISLIGWRAKIIEIFYICNILSKLGLSKKEKEYRGGTLSSP
jgi:hypothetical protein